MRKLWLNCFYVLLAVTLAAWAITPPQDRLRPGKDLAGGVALVYQVELKPTDPSDTIPRMIELLKRRVDPDGVLDITMVQQGSNRIEITMPLPSANVKIFKAAFETALDSLSDGALTSDQFGRLMADNPEVRLSEITRLSAADADRKSFLEAAVASFDTAQSARKGFNESLPGLQQAKIDAQAALNNALQQAQTPEQLKPLQDALAAQQTAIDNAAAAVVNAEQAFTDARANALGTSIPAADVRRALELSDRDRIIKPDRPGEPASVIESPRKRAIARLKETHPGAIARLNTVLDKHAEFSKNRATLDDPSDLKRLLRGAGVLEFRIAAQGPLPDEPRLRAELRAKGPKAVKATDTRWFKINKLESWYDTPEQFRAITANPAAFFSNRQLIAEEFDGEIYLLLYDSQTASLLQGVGGQWKVAGARASTDDLGRPAIAFYMDPAGALRMGVLTETNKQRPMAVLLDDQVYTAPTIQSRIQSNGQITGNFSNEEITYIVRSLAAGSLAAKLSPEPIGENTIGPELGKDNLQRGLTAGIIAFVLVSAFMIVYYFAGGVVAVISLLINALLILALMSINSAKFSLPGIAGIILTFGMAVDANVLIYERYREEILRGADFKTAVRLAFSRALSAIVDGNVAMLIVAIVLGFTGTPEIRGFAITMSIGSLTTFFSQLFVTRVIFALLVDKLHWKSMSMLPLAFPALNRFLHPNISWMSFKPAFIGFSLTVTALSIAVVLSRGTDLLDNEFRGGTKVTMQFKELPGDDKKFETRTRAQVEAQLEAKVEELKKLPENSVLIGFRPMVQMINPTGDSSSRFAVKTSITDSRAISKAVTEAFADLLDIQNPLAFDGSDVLSAAVAPIRPLTIKGTLSENIDPALLANLPKGPLETDVTDFVGGGIVLMKNIQAGSSGPPSIVSLENRLREMRVDPAFAVALGRVHRFIVLDGDDRQVRSAALLFKDNSVSYLDNSSSWITEVRESEWALLKAAMQRENSLAGVESFSPSIAKTFAAQAIVALILSGVLIIIYVWVRFAHLRYSLAAILATLHDCIVALGFIAAAGYVVQFAPGLAQALGLLDFKVDLNVIAAVLTILGYSLNDTIVIMDRIRENRGKLPFATAAIINRSINETLGRTFITSGLTIIATGVLYVWGGEAIRAFAFCFLVGVLTGTYSSVAVAAPVVWSRKLEAQNIRPGSTASPLATRPA